VAVDAGAATAVAAVIAADFVHAVGLADAGRADTEILGTLAHAADPLTAVKPAFLALALGDAVGDTLAAGALPAGTGQTVGFMDAAHGLVTGIVGAEVAVVTGQLVGSGQTLAPLAVIPHRAHVVVAAVALVGLMHAPCVAIARIVGAPVAVVAVERRSALADTLGALLTHRAGIFVITGSRVEGVETAGEGIATVRSAHQAVVAVEDSGKEALPVCTVVTGGAFVPIVAAAPSRHVHAPQRGLTGILGAGVGIVALGLILPTHALTLDAVVTLGADITVVALGLGRGMEATRLGMTGILGALVGIVAVHGNAAHTFALGAGLPHGTEVAVITGNRVLGVETTADRIATIGGAQVAVVTVEAPGEDTVPAVAVISNCTETAVVACPRLRHVETAGLAVA